MWLFWSFAVGALLLLWLKHLNRDYHVMAFFPKRIKTIDGTPVEEIAATPKGKTIFGNAFDVIGLDMVGLFNFSRRMAAEMKKSYIQYSFGFSIYNIITAEDAELALNEPNFIQKGFFYNYLHPFLRTGLLTSTGRKWHQRRKMLTPAFHFNILGQFEEIFKEESQKFVQKLDKKSDKVVSVSELIPVFTLNSVCETALGVSLDEQLDGDQYRASFKMIEESFMRRTQNPLYIFDALYSVFGDRNYKKHLETVHEFSSNIIKKRRKLLAEEMKNNQAEIHSVEDEFISKKKRYAMLDTLLHAEHDGLIDHIGICEEVDTFMFEGFDTTSMGLIFGLMNLSLYPDMQERCHQEIEDNISDIYTMDIAELNKLKYLECFIKETLRLYPSVPVIGRTAITETKLANKLVVPANAMVTIHFFDIHRNPKYFSNPNVFDPERFSPENSMHRHPFAFVPFSAGQRNCIGQKFAMLEMKTLLVYVLKNFQLLPIMDPKDFTFEAGIILRAKNNIKIKLLKRA